MKLNKNRIKADDNVWIAIVNPNAGTRKVARDWPQISSTLKKAAVRHAAIFTEKRGDAVEMVKQQAELGIKHFIAVGGDGTLNEVVNGIFSQTAIPASQITLALIPVGTGNDWRRTMGIPVNYKEAVMAISKGRTTLQDIGRIDFTGGNMPEVRYFANVAGMGYDALVASEVNRKKDMGAHGAYTYLASLVKSLFRYRHSQLRLSVDEQSVSAEVFSLSVGIGKYNGGGMMQLPNALPDDGLFDLTLVRRISRWTVIGQIKNLYDGSFVKHNAVTCLRGREISVSAAPNMMVEADGESVGQTPLTIHILERALRVIIA